MATTFINSFMIDEGGSQPLRCYHLTNCWRYDLAGEIDSIVRSSSFMGALKIECEPGKKKQKSIIKCDTLPYANCKNRFKWISWADIWNWIFNLCKRNFLEGLHKMGTSRCGVADYVIFLPTLYDIIFWLWSYTCKISVEHEFFFKLLNLPPQTRMLLNGLAIACNVW